MAQTLTVLSAPSDPPVFSESDELSANLSAISNLDNRQLLALRVLSRVYQLNQNSGTDYRTDFPLLIQSAQNLFGSAFNIIIAPYNAELAGRIEAVLDWSAAYTATNTISRDVDTLVAEMRVLSQLPESQLLQILFFLKWKLAE